MRPPLLLFCFVFFFLSILCGSKGVPGISVFVSGLAIGIWAAYAKWFEQPEPKHRAGQDAKHYVLKMMRKGTRRINKRFDG